jgi:hypothetical protein
VGDLVVQLRVHLQPPSLAPPVVAEPDRHAVTGVDGLLRFERQFVERLVEPFPEAPDLLWASTGVRSLQGGKHPIDLGVEEIDGRVEVTSVVGRYEIHGLVDVLLRHA